MSSKHRLRESMAPVSTPRRQLRLLEAWPPTAGFLEPKPSAVNRSKLDGCNCCVEMLCFRFRHLEGLQSNQHDAWTLCRTTSTNISNLDTCLFLEQIVCRIPTRTKMANRSGAKSLAAKYLLQLLWIFATKSACLHTCAAHKHKC